MEAVKNSQDIHDIINNALLFCRQKENLTQEEFLYALQDDQEAAHSRFRYALAKGISKYLADHDNDLQSVYVYGSTMTDNAKSASDIDLIVRVKNKNHTLHETITQLDCRLRTDYQTMLGNPDIRMKYIIDAHIVDEMDVAQRKDYGSLIASPSFTIPVKVWNRV